MIVYELVKEDWTHLGGPMGSEYTTTIWNRIFTTLERAKEVAQNDHMEDDDRRNIRWKLHSRGNEKKVWFSSDLLSHAYYIYERIVEE